MAELSPLTASGPASCSREAEGKEEAKRAGVLCRNYANMTEGLALSGLHRGESPKEAQFGGRARAGHEKPPKWPQGQPQRPMLTAGSNEDMRRRDEFMSSEGGHN